MVKHNFKVGDRVKLTNPCEWENIGDSIGIIIRLTSPYIWVDWGGVQAWKRNYPHLPEEIECVLRKGEQLMFSFMNERGLE